VGRRGLGSFLDDRPKLGDVFPDGGDLVLAH
jgi:hypothetical protein